MVEHSTADREVTGSIPVAPFNLNFFFEWLLKKPIQLAIQIVHLLHFSNEDQFRFQLEKMIITK